MRSQLSVIVMTCVSFLLATQRSAAQTPTAAPVPSVSQAAPAGPPRVIAMNGTLVNASGEPHAGRTTLTFALFADQQGGTALWTETQTVEADERGRYSVRLGTETPLPVELFQSTEARWLGVRNADGVEPPRVRLLSVPYALKAADAETLGGLPASSYVRTAGTGGGAATSAPTEAGALGDPPTSLSVENSTTPYATALGTGALAVNTISGLLNSALGYQALAANTDGDFNTAVGAQSLFTNTAGINNTAAGFASLYANTTGSGNTSVGNQALGVNTTGNNNTAVGIAMALNSTGNNNTAVGNQSLQNNVTGSFNVALGDRAGFKNSTGSSNVFIANEGNVAESNAIYIGTPGTHTKTILAGNVGIGTSGPLQKLEVANIGSTYVGVVGTFGGNAGVALTNGSGGTALLKSNAADGSFTIDTPNLAEHVRILSDGRVGINTPNPQHVFTATFGNSAYMNFVSLGGNAGQIFTAVGKEAVTRLNAADGSFVWENPNGTERMRITQAGNVGIGTTTPTNPLQMGSGAFVSAGGVWTNASSRTLKHDIADLPAAQALDAVAHLRPVTFAYNAEPNQTHVGFIAEDVPDLVASQDRKSLSAMDIVAVLTKVVQSQQTTIAEQRGTIEDLAARLAKFEAILATLTSGRDVAVDRRK